MKTELSPLDLALRLLRVARPVLAPLGVSYLARCGALLLGVAMYGLAGWQILAHAAGDGGRALSGGVFGEAVASSSSDATWSVLLPLTSIVWLLVGMSLAKALLRYLEQFAGHWVAFRSLALLRNFFYDRLEPQAPALTETMDSGDLMSRVTKDVDRIEVFFAHTLVPLAAAVTVPPVVLIWLGLEVSWPLAAIVAVALIAAGVVAPRIGGKASERAASRIRRARGQLAHHVTDSVQGVREVLAFGAESRRHDGMREIEDEIAASQIVMGRFVAVRRGVIQFLLAACLVAVAWCGAHLVGVDAITLPQLGLALGVTLGVFAPVLAVEDFAVDLDQAWASARRVFDVTERAPLVDDAHAATASDREWRGDDIEISGLSFTYPRLNGAEGTPAGRTQVLHDVSLHVSAGSTTAIVGASGSGKSTLAALLARTWDPDSGTIAIGGADIRTVPLEQLRDQVAFAPQRPHLFNMSIRDNLLLARPEASEAELAAALEATALSSWVEAETDGLDTVVGELGERISGGQRQRLALARTLLRPGSIVILDEATSQLDAATEKQVLAGISRAVQGKTVIVVAHRISTVTDADQIVVMDRGRIVEVGTWDDLMGRGGALAALAAREGVGLAGADTR